jgi:hypothetical protein
MLRDTRPVAMTPAELQAEVHARLDRMMELWTELDALWTQRAAMNNSDPLTLDVAIERADTEFRDCLMRIDTLRTDVRLALGLAPDPAQ